MESTQNLKKRIKSVANINKITKAMELVAATKMRRAQEIALASRPYAFAALQLLANVSLLEKSAKLEIPRLLKKRNVTKTLFVLVASDKGLAGAFNSSLFRKFERYITEHKSDINNTFVAVGEKTNGYLVRNKFNVVKKFTNVGDFTSTAQVQPLADFMVEGFLNREWDRVVVFSTHFKSALKQEALIRELLPVDFENIKKTVIEVVPETGKFAELLKEQNISFAPEKSIKDYLIEPSPNNVLENLARHLVFMQMYHVILEANASEHSARRLAMKTASDNASELGETLNLQYNKSRQAGITNQIIEIVSGAESLN